MAVLCVYREYDYWTTGFYVPDELGYAHDAMQGTYYGPRWFFGWLNIDLFRLFSIHTVTPYFLLLPFYMFLWSFTTIYFYYRILKLLRLDPTTIALSLFSSLFLVSFVLLSLGFLTEPVGLSLAMVGTYFMLKIVVRGGERDLTLLVYPLLSALFFVAAAGTREPYDIFQVGGMLLVLLAVLSQRHGLRHLSSPRRKALMAVSVCMFLIPSAIFLQYPNGELSGVVMPTLQGFLSNFFGRTNQPHSSTSTVTSTTSTTVTGENTSTHTYPVNSTITTVINGTTTTIVRSGLTTSLVVETTTQTIQTTTSTTVVTPPRQPFFLAQSIVGNTILIFLGGLLLGWGPILLVLAAAGLILLLLRIRRAGPDRKLVLLLALLALGSYFGVSFIFSSDPFYLSFTNYSTIIRFSDTAIPACFLMTPFAISAIASRGRRYVWSVVAVFVIFLLVAVPAYETYAASTLTAGGGANPFNPGYRTDAVLIRDYFMTNRNPNGSILVEYPVGWDFTPGTDIINAKVYTLTPGSSVPSISYQDFLHCRWQTFYIYNASDIAAVRSQAPYLLPMILANAPTNTTSPNTVTDKEVVLTGNDFSLIRVQLSWP